MSLSQITDYASLQAAAAGMVHRDSDTAITGNMPLFIQMAEQELYDRMVLVRDWQAESTLTSTQGQNYIALPSGFISPVTLWILLGTSPNWLRTELTPALPEQLPYWPNQAIPRYWAIDGDNIRFDTNFDAVYSLPFRFIQKTALSNSTTTNYLITRRPDIYLYATLKQVALFQQDDEALQKYDALLTQAIKAFKASEARSRSVAPLRADAALIGSAHEAFNIYRGP